MSETCKCGSIPYEDASMYNASYGVSSLHGSFRMNINTLLLATVLAFQNLCDCPAEERGLPLVEETVDEIAYVQTAGCDHLRVVFIKNGQVLATRLYVDDMISINIDGEHTLVWQDYWTAERVVHAKKYSSWYVKADPTQEGQDGLWWCMFRNMKDLKQP